jgi:hypothetical protein
LTAGRWEATAQSAGLPRQGILQLADQGRNILRDRLDDDFEIDAGVAVDDLARCHRRSPRMSSAVRPFASSTASRAASSMCRMRIRSSCRVMKRDGFSKDLISEIGAERPWRA